MKHHNLLADTLTIIRNASRVHKVKVDVPASKMVRSILETLKREAYIEDFKPLEEGSRKSFRVYLKFDADNQPLISGLKCISKPSLRVYRDHHKLPRVLRGQGIAVISTSRGILTDDAARAAKVGGEVICYIW